jgi:putative drug exporter of the RND superfamily
VHSWIESLAGAAARRPRRTVGLWLLAVAVAVGLIATLLPSALTTEGEVTSNPESEQAYALIDERLPQEDETVNELVVVHSAQRDVYEPVFEAKVREVRRQIEELGTTENIQDYLEAPDLVSEDRHSAVLTLDLGPNAEDDIEDIIAVVRAAAGGGFETAITGEFTADRDFLELSNSDLKEGELFFGLPAALIVLVLVFGTLVGALVPLILAIVSIIVALALVAVLGQAFELSFFVVNMLSGMGLALGIDYALFVVSRYREERAGSREKLDAIAASARTATRAVFVSGLAFVLAMFGMVIVPDTILRSLAVGAILVGIVAVVAALTLLPAVLAILGDRVDRLRVPLLGRLSAGDEGRFWSAIVRSVMRRPLVFATASVALLLAAALPVLDLATGLPGIRTLPDSYPAKQGFLLLEREFGVGTPDSVQVVVDGDLSEPGVRAGAERLVERLDADPVFGEPELIVAPNEDLAVVEALVAGDSRDRSTVRAVERLRSDVVPAALEGTRARGLVTGETAEIIDYRELTSYWLPIVFAFVLGLSFVLLTLAFRSIVVAIKAILLNLLSVGAAYGLLVLVFQKGHGNELFGFQQVDSIAAWLPLFLFSVLFGLSMDYHVFLLSRIRERYLQTGENSEAVAHGVGSTARLITGAALIIIAVFAGFASGQLVEFQQMGFGVAVSLLIDATLIRSVLLPATMQLLGDRNWYLPGWLEWLPHLEVEGPGRQPDEAPVTTS